MWWSSNPMALRWLSWFMLDSGSQASLISESRANAIKAMVLGNSISITSFWSSSSKNGVLSTFPNDAVHFKSCSPTKSEDPNAGKRQKSLSGWSKLQFPEATSCLEQADVLEDVMKQGKCKENGLHIRKSIFGWIVSWPVQQGTCSTR